MIENYSASDLKALISALESQIDEARQAGEGELLAALLEKARAAHAEALVLRAA